MKDEHNNTREITDVLLNIYNQLIEVDQSHFTSLAQKAHDNYGVENILRDLLKLNSSMLKITTFSVTSILGFFIAIGNWAF